MKRLYIDFDGVIMDTIPYLYAALNKEGIDPRVNDEAAINFFSTYDFRNVIKDEYILNDSINCIQKIIDSSLFDVHILTHVISLKEGVVKINYLRKYFKEITIIIVPKEINKTDVLNAKDAILIDDYPINLEIWEKAGGIGVRFSNELKSAGFKVINKLDQIFDVIGS